MYYVNKYVFKCFLNIMTLGAHYINDNKVYYTNYSMITYIIHHDILYYFLGYSQHELLQYMKFLKYYHNYFFL